MPPPANPKPANPKIYHIVHVDRLPSIIAAGCLWCDAVMSRRTGGGTTIGMGSIKERRISLPVRCHPGLRVGDFVPFYFCSRSIMLYVIHKANHVELAYRGGQNPIVHLECDLQTAVAWADSARRPWAFSTINAANAAADFFCELSKLSDIDWNAVAARDWVSCRDEKQAEFLMHESFPWDLVARIGVKSQQVYNEVQNAMKAAGHRPRVEIKPDWYY